MIYLIADLHLNHRNIIRYCDRPFTSVEEMNETLITNWNKIVRRDDVVFVVGDLAFCRKGDKISQWTNQLNGHIILIVGNHDRGNLDSVLHMDKCILTYKGRELLLVHDPHTVNGWEGFVVHGHVHNNDLVNFPFMNRERKTINVGVELINYTPVSIDFLIEAIEDKTKG